MNQVETRRAASPSPRTGWGEILRDNRRQELLLAIVIFFFAGFWTAHRYHLSLPEVWKMITQRSTDPPWLASAGKLDPAVGSTIKLPSFYTAEGSVELPSNSGLTGLVFITNCTQCSAKKDIVALEGMTRKYPNLNIHVVVMDGDVNTMHKILAQSSVKLNVVADLRGRGAELLNAYFNFRGYIFDHTGKLLYMTARNQAVDEIDAALYEIIQKHGDGRP